MVSFENFYKNMGLVEYPFSVYTTELEIERAKELFYPSTEYGPMIESYKSKRSTIILGERGVGKTAIKEDFIRQSQKSVIAVITNF